MLEYLILSSMDEAVIQEWRKPHPVYTAPAPTRVIPEDLWTVIATATGYSEYGALSGEMPLIPDGAHSSQITVTMRILARSPAWIPK